MRVMSAGVHYMDVLTVIVFGEDLAGVGQTSLFFYRQRIRVRAHKHCWPVAILHHSHHSVSLVLGVFIFSEMLCDLAACSAQFLRDKCCGSLLISGQFRVTVKILVDPKQRGKLSVSK